MSTETKPYVSDEQIHARVDEYTLPYRTEITRVTKEFRDKYESHLTELRMERVRLLRMVDDAEWRLRDVADIAIDVPGLGNDNQLRFVKDRAAQSLILSTLNTPTTDGNQ